MIRDMTPRWTALAQLGEIARVGTIMLVPLILAGLAPWQACANPYFDPGMSGVWLPIAPPISLDRDNTVLDSHRQRLVAIEARGATHYVWSFSLSAPGNWELLVPDGVPPTDWGTPVYDPARDRVLLLPGTSGSVFALSLSGRPAWSQVATVGQQPSPLYSGYLYDAAHDRVLSKPILTTSLIWSLSLTGIPTWGQIEFSNGPPPVYGGTPSVLDPSGDRLITCSGSEQSGVPAVLVSILAGTPHWEWVYVPGESPPPRNSHALFFDPVRHQTLMSGGIPTGGSPSDALGDVWALSLDPTPNWVRVSGITPRFGHDAFYEAGTDRMVACTGSDWRNEYLPSIELVPLSAQSAAYSLLNPPREPYIPPYHYVRGGMATTFDPFPGRMVTFGGDDSQLDPGYLGFGSILWLDTDAHWNTTQNFEGATSPVARIRSTLTYDGSRDRAVLFAGFGGMYPVLHELNDTWLLDLRGAPTWSPLLVPGPIPPARHGHVAVMDSQDGRLIVFGGLGLNDSWSLDTGGSPSWSQLFPAGSPPPSGGDYAGVYDPGENRLVVFGASGGDDSWALDLSPTPAWSVLPVAGPRPSARSGHSAVYDPLRQRMVIHGGAGSSGSNGATWALELTGPPRWTLLSSDGDVRSGHVAVYDSNYDRMIVYGGVRGAAMLSWSNVSGVGLEQPVAVPTSGWIELSAPSTNPFSSKTTVWMSAPRAEPIDIGVFDVSGRVVRRMGSRLVADSPTAIAWDGRSEEGELVRSGVYWITAMGRGGAASRKVLLIH